MVQLEGIVDLEDLKRKMRRVDGRSGRRHVEQGEALQVGEVARGKKGAKGISSAWTKFSERRLIFDRPSPPPPKRLPGMLNAGILQA